MEGRLARVACFRCAACGSALAWPFHRWDSKAGLNSIFAGDIIPLSGIVGPTHWQRTSAF
jgi:hypothetical protein